MLLTPQHKLGLSKREKIEVVNYILMSVCDIDYTRHRNLIHAIVQVRSGRVVYLFFPGAAFKVKPNRNTA